MSVLLDRPRRARRGSVPSRTRLLAAVAALFAFDGAVFGSWAARIPDVTTQVGASHTALGLALLCVSIGALASMQLAGALCARLGAGLVASVSAVLICVAVTLPGLARSLPELAAALLAFGAATGAVNVAANSAGVRLEAAGDRPIMPGLHAAFSFGGLFGAAARRCRVRAAARWPRTCWSWPRSGCCSPPRSRRCSSRRRRARAADRRPSRPVRRAATDASTAPRRALLVVLGLIAGLHGLRRGRDHRLGRPAPAGDPGGDPGRGRRRIRRVLTGDGLRAARWAAGSCGPSGRRTSSSSGSALAATGMLAAALAPVAASGAGRLRARRAGPGQRLPARDRPRRVRSAGRRGWPWPRPSATPDCSAARP